MIRRREFITLLGGAAAAWPRAARAQPSAVPVVGYLGAVSTDTAGMIRRGLSEVGYVEGRNIVFEDRLADGRYDRLASLAADLVRRQVTVLITSGSPAALAAKAATTTIPIVFGFGDDPAKHGLVTSLNGPGCNLTGITFLTSQLDSKRLGLLREIVPQANGGIAVLLNHTNTNAGNQSSEVKQAARSLGLQVHIVNASSEGEFESAFATIAQTGAGALLVAGDPFYFSRREKLVALAARHAIPTMYDFRAYPGTDLTEAYRQVGVYAGRILKGAKPADLPVMQSVRFEFVINLKTAKAL